MDRWGFTLLVWLLMAVGAPLAAPAAERVLSADTGTYGGDFDEFLMQGAIRVAVPLSRTLFFYDKGRQCGLIADALYDLELRLKKDYRGKLNLVITPMSFDRLLPSVVEGKADFAAGNIAVTPDRAEVVDFTAPSTDPMNEIVVTGPGAPALQSIDDLSGREVHVRGATSYRQRLDALNERFAAQGKAPVKITLLPAELQDEDELDMLNAGLIHITVKDDRLADLWKRSLPRITPRPDLVLHANGPIAWAVRKNSPKLIAVLNSILSTATRKGLQQEIYAQFELDAKKMRNARGDADMRRFDALAALFVKYGAQYRFDNLLLMALGFQESELDQNVRSPAGAIGVMQIMPATARMLAVGDVRQVEPNIHGGAKLMAKLMDEYFKDAAFDETNRTLFAFACYNAGPTGVVRSRELAIKQGLDPNVWFNNVEVVAAKTMGQGLARYVRSVFKYYVAYKLEEDARAERDKALQKS